MRHEPSLGPALAQALGVVAVVISAAGWLPQLARLRRTGDVAGVSLAAMANSLVSLVGWTAYGWLLHDRWVVGQSLVGLVPAVATIVVAARAGARRSGLHLPLVWATMLATCAALAPLVGVGLVTVVLGCSVLWLVAPAALTAWRSPVVSGIAWGTWALTVANALVSGTYGVLAHVPANVVYGVVALTGGGVILARLALGDRDAVPGRTRRLDRAPRALDDSRALTRT